MLTSQLRCSREENGCLRCRSSGLTCDYDTPRPKRRRMGTSTSRITCNTNIQIQSTPLGVPGTEIQLRNAPPAEVQNGILDDAAIYGQGLTVESDLFNFLDVNFEDTFNDYPALAFSRSSDPESSQSDTGSDDPTQTRLSGGPTRNACNCLASAVSLLEVISIQYMQVNLKSVPQLIRHNKSALLQCRALHSCDLCSKKSEFVMLLILLCQKIIASYQHIVIILIEQFNRLHRPNGDDEIEISVPTMESAMATAREVELREYQVDVEEEPCVFGGVVQMQVKKMAAFLRMLKAMLIAYNWPSHIAMLDLVGNDVKKLSRLCSCPVGLN
jgi:hypothetical protein